MGRNETTLARARKRTGLEQGQAARKLGVTVEHLCRVERGRAGMSDELMRRIAQLYRISQSRVTRWHERAKRAQLRGAMKRAGMGGSRGRSAA